MAKPWRDDRSVRFRFGHPDLRPETEVSDRCAQSVRQCQQFMPPEALFRVRLNPLSQNKRLVQRQRADRPLEEKLLFILRQMPESLVVLGGLRLGEPILYARRGQALLHRMRYRARISLKLVRFEGPIRLDVAREVSHRVSLNPHTRDPMFLALHQDSSGAAKRIEDCAIRTNLEAFKVVPDKVRRE